MHRVRRGLARTLCGLLAGSSLVAGCAALAAPLTVQEYQCQLDGQVRSVSVRLDDAVAPAACDVRYRKLTELLSHDEILWRATTGLRFCRERAEILHRKLERWGWRCALHEPAGSSLPSTQGATPSEPPAAPAGPSLAPVAAPSEPPAAPASASLARPRVTAPSEPRAAPASMEIQEQAAAIRESFAAGYGKSAVHAPVSLVVHGDLDGDGDSDAVVGYVALVRRGGVRAVISVFRNEGDQRFRHVASRALGANRWPGRLRIADGRIILATTEHGAQHAVARRDVYSLREGTLVRLISD